MTILEKEGPVCQLQDNLKVARAQRLSLSLARKMLMSKPVNRRAFMGRNLLVWELLKICPLSFQSFGFSRNVQLICVTKEIGHFLGVLVGSVLDVDVGAAVEGSGKFLQIRVRIESTLPLRCYLRVDVMGDGEETVMLRGIVPDNRLGHKGHWSGADRYQERKGQGGSSKGSDAMASWHPSGPKDSCRMRGPECSDSCDPRADCNPVSFGSGCDSGVNGQDWSEPVFKGLNSPKATVKGKEKVVLGPGMGSISPQLDELKSISSKPVKLGVIGPVSEVMLSTPLMKIDGSGRDTSDLDVKIKDLVKGRGLN
ncbi:hypothetical protein QYF36_015838 [Acer negundo]|nr:hypothetical protein QYF36_015838 [Acer negundo]